MDAWMATALVTLAFAAGALIGRGSITLSGVRAASKAAVACAADPGRFKLVRRPSARTIRRCFAQTQILCSAQYWHERQKRYATLWLL